MTERSLRLCLAAVEQPLREALPSCYELYARIDALVGLGPTTTSKLLARKRPRLLPVLDTVTRRALGNPRQAWEPLRLRLRDGLAEDLRALALEAEIPSHVSILRVLDVVLWMRHRPRRGNAGQTRVDP